MLQNGVISNKKIGLYALILLSTILLILTFGTGVHPNTPVLCCHITMDENDRKDLYENYEEKGLEKPCHINITGGKCLYDGDYGIKIVGRSTRKLSQKSFEISSGRTHGSGSDFDGKMFGLMTDFDNIRLKNSGNDTGLAYMRNALAFKLARDAGYYMTVAPLPCETWINNEYYGLMWLMPEDNNANYVASMTGYSEDTVEIYEDHSVAMVSKATMHSDPKFNEIYIAIHDGMPVEEAIKQCFDIGEYLKYMAFNFYINNRDMQGCNVIYYKAGGDPKFHPLFHDLDISFDFPYKYNGQGVEDDRTILASMLEENMILNYLLMESDNKDEYRDMFIGYIKELASGALSENNVNRRIRQLSDIIRPVVIKTVSTPELTKCTWGYYDDVSEDTWNRSVALLYESTHFRKESVEKDLKECFGEDIIL